MGKSQESGWSGSLLGAATGLAALLLLIGCGPTATDHESAVADAAHQLRRGLGGEPGSLDPALAEDEHAFKVLIDLYEGLLSYRADGSVGPGVASDWSVSPDGLRYRFRLRPRLVWSDGTPLVAGDFVAGFRHVLDPRSRAPMAALLSPVANAMLVLRGELTPEQLGIRAEGDDQLVISLARAAPWFPEILAHPVAFPRPPQRDGDGSEAAEFVGNGPYLLQQRIPGASLLLRRNYRYREADQVTIESVRYLPVADPAVEYQMYRAGQLDITATVPPSAFDALQREHRDELSVAPGLTLYYVAPDLGEPPLDQRELRAALSLAIDRKRLVELLGRGELPAFSVVPPGVGTGEPMSYDWQDLPAAAREARARSALAAAGYDGTSAPEITISYDAGDVHEKVALALRSMWQEVLGLEVALMKLEWKALLALREDRSQWQLMRFAWAGDYRDPIAFLDLFRSHDPNNLPGYANAHYDRLLVEASATSDRRSRRRVLADAERILLEDHALLPLYFPVHKHLVHPRVQGFKGNALDRHPSRHLSLQLPE